MGNKESFLLEPKTDVESDGGTVVDPQKLAISYGAGSMQGWRKNQEDKFTCKANFSEKYSFFALYDGHGGAEIANFLQKNLHSDIENFLGCNDDDIELELYNAFLSTDLSLMDPEVIAEMNSQLDAENCGTDQERVNLVRQKCFSRFRKKMTASVESGMQSDGVRKQDADSSEAAVAGSSTQMDSANSSEAAVAGTRTHIDSVHSSEADAASSSTFLDSTVSSEVIDAGLSSHSNCAGLSSTAQNTVSEEEEPVSSTQDLNIVGQDLNLESGNATVSPDLDGISQDLGAAGSSRLYGSSTEEKNNKGIYDLVSYLQEEIASDPDDEEFVLKEEEDTMSESESEEESEIPTSQLTAEEFANLQPGDLCGATATIVLIKRGTVYVANVGDSRCVLSRSGRAEDLTIDHHPTDDLEEERIKLNGGTVRRGRVNDTLDISRAFGDFKLKGSSLNPPEQLVTVEPNIITLPLKDEDEFLVIASDGIWNAMSSQEVIDYIRMRLRFPDCDLRDVCEEIFHLILAPNCDNDGTGCDNMSCVIVRFNELGSRRHLPPSPGQRIIVPISGRCVMATSLTSSPMGFKRSLYPREEVDDEETEEDDSDECGYSECGDESDESILTD